MIVMYLIIVPIDIGLLNSHNFQIFNWHHTLIRFYIRIWKLKTILGTFGYFVNNVLNLDIINIYIYLFI